MTASGRYELLAQCLVMFCAFVPFFAFKELEEMMGPDESPEPVLEASGCGARSIPPGDRQQRGDHDPRALDGHPS